MEDSPTPTNSDYANLLVVLRLGEIEGQARQLMHDVEWNEFQTALDNARKSEELLRELGLWPNSNQDDDAKLCAAGDGVFAAPRNRSAVTC
jgi:hypothetical protein